MVTQSVCVLSIALTCMCSMPIGLAVVLTTPRGPVDMPSIAFGTGGGPSLGAKTQNAVSAALRNGYRAFDTASLYANLPMVGAALNAPGAPPRNEVFIINKVPGCAKKGSASDCARATTAEIQNNMAQLGVDHIDLLMPHSAPDAWDRAIKQPKTRKEACDKLRAQWAALEDAYLANLTRAIGVSNYCLSCFDCLNARDMQQPRVQPAVNQVKVRVGRGEDPGGLLSYARNHSIVVQSYSPIMSRSVWDPAVRKAEDAIGRSYGKTAAQVAIKWLLQRGVSVVVRSTNDDHQRENLVVANSDWHLRDDDMKQLATVKSKDAATFAWQCS
mmetsp:Transcript_21686/g.55827  ORF Transcript_21686/g.55827 Transcript_21686/m.55827 type:complete len:329 (-) Transcript_21686:416-1402(-)